MNAIDKMSMLNKSIDIFNYAIRHCCPLKVVDDYYKV